MGTVDLSDTSVIRIRRNRSGIGQVVDAKMSCAAGWNRNSIGSGWFTVRKIEGDRDLRVDVGCVQQAQLFVTGHLRGGPMTL